MLGFVFVWICVFGVIDIIIIFLLIIIVIIIITKTIHENAKKKARKICVANGNLYAIFFSFISSSLNIILFSTQGSKSPKTPPPTRKHGQTDRNTEEADRKEK